MSKLSRSGRSFGLILREMTETKGIDDDEHLLNEENNVKERWKNCFEALHVRIELQTGICGLIVAINSIYIDSCLYDFKEESGLRIYELYVKCLLYADDQIILAPSVCGLQELNRDEVGLKTWYFAHSTPRRLATDADLDTIAGQSIFWEFFLAMSVQA
ncbi:hypothetical protein EVAR_93376_1 [Eumeta japonica]|uniref:Reverse transcriptase domain-containing protein n=1 Tax=Eumeta variegata TaxID=151549 RepID=A0A4C1SBC8_EUMVA|nr:hypothetical protein EVAR_93376_1 [Eumeta japonica]